MASKFLLNDLFNHWGRQRHLKLAPKLSQSEIMAFEMKNGISIPDDFSQYLRHANGFKALTEDMDLDASDDEGFEFHPLLEDYLITDRYLVFCSWPNGFLKYALCVENATTNGRVVQVIDEKRGYLLANNFLAFISFYLTDSELLYKAGNEVIALD